MSDENEIEEDDAIVQEFLIESYENLDALDREFVELERSPEDLEIISSIFRTIHTIKGTSGFLAFNKLETVTHRGENLLSQLRDGAKRIDPEITSCLLSMVDAVRDILSSIEASGQEGDGDYTALIANLERLTEVTQQDAGEASGDAKSDGAAEAADAGSLESGAGEDEATATASDASAEVAVPTDAAEIDVAAAASPSTPSPTPAPEPSPSEASPTAAKATKSAGAPPSPPGGGSRGGSLADSSIRVDVRLLDKLMNQVGELVLARNQVLQYSAEHSDAGFLATCQRLNQITTELQEGVMKTRMQPIENVWSKFPRVVRDLANACDKQITVQMEGKQTELDKTILESIKDPLTHVVRNSVDHGIESPEDRVAAGKPAEGKLQLRAFHEGGLVNIEIADDGGGIDPVKLKAKAIEKNVVSAERAEN